MQFGIYEYLNGFMLSPSLTFTLIYLTVLQSCCHGLFLLLFTFEAITFFLRTALLRNYSQALRVTQCNPVVLSSLLTVLPFCSRGAVVKLPRLLPSLPSFPIPSLISQQLDSPYININVPRLPLQASEPPAALPCVRHRNHNLCGLRERASPVASDLNVDRSQSMQEALWKEVTSASWESTFVLRQGLIFPRLIFISVCNPRVSLHAAY